MPDIERSFGDTEVARTLRAMGAIIIGAYCGAIIGTPTIKDFTSIPDFGLFTAIDAVIGAFLFLTGMRLLQSNAPRGQIWLGGVFVGGVTGAFLGAMFPMVGSVIMGIVVALLFGSFVIWSPYREDPRAGFVWSVTSAVLVGVFFFCLASLFPIVQRHHATGYLIALLFVCVPCGIMGTIGGFIFARQTGSRKRLTFVSTLLIVLAAAVPFVLYHVPLRTIAFPKEREVGTIRFSDWFEFKGHPAQGMVKVPMRGIIYLQLDPAAATDLTFFEDMPGLRELDMTGVDVGDEAIAQLAALKNLTFLSLADTPVTDAALAHIGALRALERLELSGTQITGPGLAHIAGLPVLEVLGLGRTQVGDAAMEHVATLPSLRELGLYGTPVGDAGLVHLATIETLERLELYMTQVTTGGLEAFREERPDCNVLH